MRRTRLLAIVVGLTTLAIPLTARAPQGAKPRLMTVRDAQNMVSVGVAGDLAGRPVGALHARRSATGTTRSCGRGRTSGA